MAGIYIHIPFCRQACHYCNFHFTTSLRYKKDFVDALLQEIIVQQNYLEGEVIDTIYFGGGTPSLLSGAELEAVLSGLQQFYTINKNAEITLEANPDDITTNSLDIWKATGVNRLSIGVQSFFDDDLQWMNRAHTGQQATESLKAAFAQFENITIDLIYGTPLLTNEKWKRNVDLALQLNIPHLSCYALTVEPKTPLDKLIRQKKIVPVDVEKQSIQFLLLMEWLQVAGYEHYEISNFCKPGWESRHNSSYWSGKKYLGLGPSAHSYNGKERQWNISNNHRYIESLKQRIVSFEKEILTPTQQINEYVMTALRTAAGIDLRVVEDYFKVSPGSLLQKTSKYVNDGLLVHEDGTIYLSRRGKLFADGIAADLFF